MTDSDSRTIVEQVKDATAIEEIAAGYTRLKPDGQRRLRGLCPIHQERHPSFVVYPDQGRWWCYGACGRGGDVIDLMMAVERLSFGQALDRLATRAGIPRPAPDPSAERQAQMRRAVQDILAVAVAYYQAHLWKEPKGLALLTGRGFTRETIQAAGLVAHLRARGVDLGLAQQAGVVRSDGRDYFTQRLIIPYFARGKVVYLSGRALYPGQAPKYLHLPTSRWLQRPLYNSDALRSSGELFVVEGFADVLTLAQWGFHAVGLNGTRLKDDDLPLLRRADSVCLALDNDPAGQQAASALAGRIGPETRVLAWPEGI
jgi:DNA primase